MPLINKPIHIVMRKVGIFFMIFCLMVISYYLGMKFPAFDDTCQFSMDTQIVVIDSSHAELTWENIDYWLERLDIKHPDVVKRQIKLECCGDKDFSSDLAINNKNILGLKCAKQRQYTYTFERAGHAGYPTYVHCLADYALWQRKYYDGERDYYEFLKAYNYATDARYIWKLKNINLEQQAKND